MAKITKELLHNEFAKNIINEINLGKINSQRDFSERRFFWSKNLKLNQMPSNPYILSKAKNP